MDNADEISQHDPQSDQFDDGKRLASEQGSASSIDSEDDLFLGTDAQAFSSSRKSVFSSDGSDSVFTGLRSESVNESPRDTGARRVIKALAHVGRIDSSDSLVSGFSDSSRNSLEVISLLNARTVDPEEFLADLGFAEPDMRSRIPDRFLQGQSKAHGIDVDYFRRSLDQDDLYASLSQESPVWSDSGSCRIPLRFISSEKEPVQPVFGEGFNSVPLINEPDEAPEGSFDLMRHLRLNKPCHVTKGMFLEPVTEEVEVSSVGSGTVRSKISRKLSNEEGTIIARAESLENANVESELLLSVPVVQSPEEDLESTSILKLSCSEEEANIPRAESLEQTNVKSEVSLGVPLVENATEIMKSNEFIVREVSDNQAEVESLVLATEGGENNDMEGVDEISSESGEANCIDHHAENSVAGVETKEGEETPATLPSLAHLRVAGVVVQDSFELEEITTSEDFNDKESSYGDSNVGTNVTVVRRPLTRENSGESSGFEEMILDKETLSPNSDSPTESVERFHDDDSANGKFTSLAALLDPEMVSLVAEKVDKGDKSPRATFGQRRSKSLTKQRPVDEDTLASYVFFHSIPAPKDVAYDGEFLGTKLNHDTFPVDFQPSVNDNPSKDNSSIDLLTSVSDNIAMDKKSFSVESDDDRQQETDSLLEESCGGELMNNKEPIVVKEFEGIAILRSAPSSTETIENERDYQKVSSSTEENTDDIELTDSTNQTTEEYLPTDDSEHNCSVAGEMSQFEGEFERSCDILAAESNAVSSVPEERAAATSVGACAEETITEDFQNASRNVDSLCQQHYLHEINVLEQNIQKYESCLSSAGPLDALKTLYCTKHTIARITEEMNAIQGLRVQIANELERMKQLLDERRLMLQEGIAHGAVGSNVSQKMADLLREQSSLSNGLSNISDEVSIRTKASRRARVFFNIERAKRELKEERERCLREFREEIKEGVVRELSERFLSDIEELRREVRSKDEIIENLLKNQSNRDLKDCS